MMDYSLKPNFKVAGPVMGSKIKAFGEALSKAEASLFFSGEPVSMEIAGETMMVTTDMVDIKISAREGFAVAMENNVFTILDTTLTPDLIDEGLARELVSKVQQLRKQMDFEMMDHIRIHLSADEEVTGAGKTPGLHYERNPCQGSGNRSRFGNL